MLRLRVTDREPAQVQGDVVAALFRPRTGFPAALRLAPGAERMAARAEDALTWLPTRRMAAPRALLVSLGAERLRPGLGGLCGDRSPSEVALHERHELRATGARLEAACTQAEVRHLVLAEAPDGADLGLVVEGILLASYQSNEWRDREPTTSLRRVTICVPPGRRREETQRLREIETVARATNFARELGDLPSNIGTPHGVVERVRGPAREVGLELRVLDLPTARRRGLGLFCAVAAGGGSPGCILELEHKRSLARRLPTLVLIGKGITHDTGGYNAKASPNLYLYTHDKCGATAVIGAMYAIAALDLPVHVVAILPLAENCIDAHAFKPGDILTALDGTTVFVESTDAEGRLVLGDALCLAARRRPDAVIDLATLTRDSADAMGDPMAALFSNSDRLRDLLVAAGQASDDLVWPMPIHEVHEREICHFKADLKNLGGATGGASSAAAFLRRFVDVPWAHIDLAGKAAWEFPRDYLREGASGFGCRLLVEAARRFAREPGTTGRPARVGEAARPRAKGPRRGA